MTNGSNRVAFHYKILTVVVWLGLPWAAVVNAQLTDRQWPFVANVDVFKLHSDFKLDDLERFHSILGSLRNDTGEMLRLPNQQSPIHIVLFSNLKEYSRYMQFYFPAIVQRRAIYLQDRGPGMLFTYWHDDIEIDLRHETVHALLNQNGVQLPLWLDEGLAEYFEIPKELRLAGNPYARAVASRAQSGLVPSLMQLEKISNIAEFTDQNYRDSWAWVHFLLHRREATRQLLVDYLSRQRKQTPQPLLSRQLADLIVDPAAEFQEHYSQLLKY